MVGRSRIRVLEAVLAVISVTGCVLTPSGPLGSGADKDGSDSSRGGTPAAGQLLARVVRRVVQDNTGSFESELIYGQVQLTWGGDYSIRESRARFQISVMRRHEDTEGSMPTTFEIVLVGARVFVRPTSLPVSPAGRWAQVSKRHLFVDLPCWPVRHRGLPDRLLMLLFNADAVGFDARRGRSVIIATVPARLAGGVFPNPSLAAVLSGEGSAPVTVRIGQFRGEVTSFELQGKAVIAALDRAGLRLDPKTARDLLEARYFAWFPGSDLPTLVQPPRARSALDLARDVPLPQAGQFCVTKDI